MADQPASIALRVPSVNWCLVAGRLAFRIWACVTVLGKVRLMKINPNRAIGHRLASDPVVVILGIVRGYYHLRAGEMIGPCRARRLAWPRQIAMALIRQKANCSLPEIGRHFGGRDHTTVMHALRAVADRRKADRQCAAEFVEIERRVALALGRSYVRREHIWGKPFVSVRKREVGQCRI